jgi:hypothetical protein
MVGSKSVADAVRERRAKQIFKVLKNAVVDTLQQWQGQRVAVNFVFFSLAYVDSEAKVDTDLCALGCVVATPPSPPSPVYIHQGRGVWLRELRGCGGARER